MDNKKVQEMYYDSEKQYNELQNLKFKIDPTDVFHNSLTVRLPTVKKN
jgi:hypothetical protein